jgi:hypothetical protein
VSAPAGACAVLCVCNHKKYGCPYGPALDPAKVFLYLSTCQTLSQKGWPCAWLSIVSSAPPVGTCRLCSADLAPLRVTAGRQWGWPSHTQPPEVPAISGGAAHSPALAAHSPALAAHSPALAAHLIRQQAMLHITVLQALVLDIVCLHTEGS